MSVEGVRREESQACSRSSPSPLPMARHVYIWVPIRGRSDPTQHGPGRVDLQAGPVGVAPTVAMTNRALPNLSPPAAYASQQPVLPFEPQVRTAHAHHPWAEGARAPPCPCLVFIRVTDHLVQTCSRTSWNLTARVSGTPAALLQRQTLAVPRFQAARPRGTSADTVSRHHTTFHENGPVQTLRPLGPTP